MPRTKCLVTQYSYTHLPENICYLFIGDVCTKPLGIVCQTVLESFCHEYLVTQLTQES